MRVVILLSALAMTGCNTSPTVSNYDEDFDATDYDTALEQEYIERLDVQACYDISDHEKDHPLTLVNIYDPDLENFGFVMLDDGKIHSALHFYKGLTRVWAFGCDDEMERCNYQVQLKPNGDMHYFDFSNAEPGESVTSSFWMQCEYDADYSYEINEEMGGFYDEARGIAEELLENVKALDVEHKI